MDNAARLAKVEVAVDKADSSASINALLDWQRSSRRPIAPMK